MVSVPRQGLFSSQAGGSFSPGVFLLPAKKNEEGSFTVTGESETQPTVHTCQERMDMKPKPKKAQPAKKYARKSPIVAVLVEKATPPVAQPVPPPAVSVPQAPEPKPQRTEAVKTIACTLGETKPGVLSQLHVIVKKLGCAEALRLLAEAQHVEAGGGMLINDGSRRRTPGGVFFALVRTHHPDVLFMPPRVKKAQPPARREDQPENKLT
jgi:hypothetical protein